MTIAVVIVNFRTPELVCECLDSLAAERALGTDFDAFVGDADSGDGSLSSITRHIEDKRYSWATCHDNGRNGGFAFGNNVILKKCVLPDPRYEFVFFLNPDTVVRPGAVQTLLTLLTRNEDVAVVGSKLENADGSLPASAFRFPTPFREFFRGARLGILDRVVPSGSIGILDLKEPTRVDWVAGAALMIRRSVLEHVGLFDEGYFLYYEEVDLLLRISRAGYWIWHEPNSEVVHLAGAATGVRAQTAQQQPIRDYWFHSRWKFYRDNYGLAAAVSANVLFLLGSLTYRLSQLLRFKRPEEPPKLWRSYLRNGFRMPLNRSDQSRV